MNFIAWILLVFFHRTSLSFPLPAWFSKCPYCHKLTPACPTYFCLPLLTTSFLSSCPCFRIQYSLNVADRLADEHVLIGLYVNMLRNNPPWLVQVWLLDSPERGEQSDLLTSSLSKGQSHWMAEVSLKYFFNQFN